jgi:hypothetical protein
MNFFLRTYKSFLFAIVAVSFMVSFSGCSDGGQAIMAAGEQPVKSASLSLYWVDIYTSDISYAGTDANIDIIIYNILEQRTETIHLTTTGAGYERNTWTRYQCWAADIGTIDHFILSHDNSRGNAGWHVGRVEIKKRNSDNSISNTYCDVNQWLATDEWPYRTWYRGLVRPL